MDIDPKLAWALRNLQIFPVDVNKADISVIMRVPGIGIQSAQKIKAGRQFNKLTWDHLKKMGIMYNRARYFITCGNEFERKDLTALQIKQEILAGSKSKYKPNFSPQLQLF
jgi:predicted DNA-binding helix-hairpin-helix protein